MKFYYKKYKEKCTSIISFRFVISVIISIFTCSSFALLFEISRYATTQLTVQTPGHVLDRRKRRILGEDRSQVCDTVERISRDRERRSRDIPRQQDRSKKSVQKRKSSRQRVSRARDGRAPVRTADARLDAANHAAQRQPAGDETRRVIGRRRGRSANRRETDATRHDSGHLPPRWSLVTHHMTRATVLR